jgi:hypothetical protein
MSNVATLYNLKIKLTSVWLGNQRTRENVRRFRRDRDGKIAVDLAQWNWTFQQAADALHMDDIDTDTIRPQVNIDPPSLVLYRRNYTHKNKQQCEMFEALRENCVLNIQVLVTTSDKQDKFPPDLARLSNIFRFTGMLLGLSPWGGQYGYGRFDVEDLTPL